MLIYQQPMNKPLGKKLREFRADRGWTQQELAKRSGIKRGYLASIEVGLVDNPSVPVFLKLASALGISPDELYQAAGYIEDNKKTHQSLDTPEDIIDHLKMVQPAAIPLYRWDDFPSGGGNDSPPVGYIYRARSRASGRDMEAYVVHDTHYVPLVDDSDIIIIDKKEPLDDGEMMACRLNGVPAVGRFRRLGGDFYIETPGGRTRLDECQSPVAIIEIRRWLEEDDRDSLAI